MIAQFLLRDFLGKFIAGFLTLLSLSLHLFPCSLQIFQTFIPTLLGGSIIAALSWLFGLSIQAVFTVILGNCHIVHWDQIPKDHGTSSKHLPPGFRWTENHAKFSQSSSAAEQGVQERLATIKEASALNFFAFIAISSALFRFGIQKPPCLLIFEMSQCSFFIAGVIFLLLAVSLRWMNWATWQAEISILFSGKDHQKRKNK